ncbi:MAG: BT4734/BF3469 family protein [Methylococcaceae bacterium]
MSSNAVAKPGPKAKPFDQAALVASDALIEALSKYKPHITKSQFATAAGVQFGSYYGKRPLPDAAIAIIKGMIASASISATADNVVELFPVEVVSDTAPADEAEAVADVIADKSLKRVTAGLGAVCDTAIIARGNNVATPWNFMLVSLGEALGEIQSTKYKNAVDAVRCEYSKHGKSEKYKNLKKLLPFYSFSGAFIDKKSISNETFLKSSSMFTVDIDGLTDIAEHKQAICAIPEVVFCFISPTGNGFKVGIRIDPDAVKSDADFKRAYYQIEAYFLKEGFTIDDACKDVSRKCFTSYDPEIYINYDAEMFVISNVVPEIQKPKAKPEQKPRTDNNTESIILGRIEKMMLGATDGNRHSIRFNAGRLLGGFIAGGLIDEQLATDIIYQLSDVIADGGATDQGEGQTIYDGIVSGKQSPLNSVNYSTPHISDHGLR